MQLAIGTELAYPCEPSWKTNLEKNWVRICQLDKRVAKAWVKTETGVDYDTEINIDPSVKLWNNKIAIVIKVDHIRPFHYLAIYKHDFKVWLIGRNSPTLK